MNKNVLQKINRSLKSKKSNSIRKTAPKVGLSRSTIVRARKRLSLKPYHIGKTTFLSDKHKQKTLQFAKKIKIQIGKTFYFVMKQTFNFNNVLIPKITFNMQSQKKK